MVLSNSCCRVPMRTREQERGAKNRRPENLIPTRSPYQLQVTGIDRIWMTMRPAKTCNSLAMVVTLSSSLISPKFSINVSTNSPVFRRYCVSTRSLILFNKIQARSVQPKLISCIFSKIENSTVSTSSTSIVFFLGYSFGSVSSLILYAMSLITIVSLDGITCILLLGTSFAY